MLEAIPELKDEKARPEIQKRLMSAAAEYQFTQDEIEGITDSRTVQVLYDAMRWRELQDGKKAGRKAPASATPVTRPKGKARGAAKTMNAKKQLQRAIKTQSTEDWANVLLEG